MVYDAYIGEKVGELLLIKGKLLVIDLLIVELKHCSKMTFLCYILNVLR